MDKEHDNITEDLFCSIPKDDAKEYRNEDQASRSPRKAVYALSDGASISFDSSTWARILTRQFAREPIVTKEWVRRAVNEFNSNYSRDELSWSGQAAFDRGSFGTLLGIEVDVSQKTVSVFAVGDSIAVLLDGEIIIDSYPYSRPDEFTSSPVMISTNPTCNTFLSDFEVSKSYQVKWSLNKLQEPLLLCMTDALGQWFLTYRGAEPSSVSLLRTITSKSQFRKLVVEERKAGRLKRDDTTLLRLC